MLTNECIDSLRTTFDTITFKQLTRYIPIIIGKRCTIAVGCHVFKTKRSGRCKCIIKTYKINIQHFLLHHCQEIEQKRWVSFRNDASQGKVTYSFVICNTYFARRDVDSKLVQSSEMYSVDLPLNNNSIVLLSFNRVYEGCWKITAVYYHCVFLECHIKVHQRYKQAKFRNAGVTDFAVSALVTVL